MWTSPNETRPLDPNDIHHLDDFGLLNVSKGLKVELPAKLNSSRWGMSFRWRGWVSFDKVYILVERSIDGQTVVVLYVYVCMYALVCQCKKDSLGFSFAHPTQNMCILPNLIVNLRYQMLLKILYYRFNFNLLTLVTLMPAVHCDSNTLDPTKPPQI